MSGTGLPHTTLHLELTRTWQGVTHHATRTAHVGARGTWHAHVQFADHGRATVQAVSVANQVKSALLGPTS